MIDMGIEARAAIFRQHHLLERPGAAVGLAGDHPGYEVRLRDDVSDAQRRRDRLRERPAMDHPVALVHRRDGRRALARPQKVRVALVLEDRHAVFRREAQELRAARFGHDAAAGILDRRDDIDEFRPHALGRKRGELRGKQVHPHASTVERDAHRPDAELAQADQRASVAELLDQHRVAGPQENLVD